MAHPFKFNEYLGDGLYADFDGYQIELYASNGVNTTNRVFLDPQVLEQFINYVEQLKESLTKRTNRGTVIEGVDDAERNGQ